MLLRWTIATVHLLALGIGLGAVWTRARGLLRLREAADLGAVLRADTLWGIAALLWISTGLWRAFGGLEKGTAYYLQSGAFHAKMGLLALVLVMEAWPMITLIRWRVRRGRAESINFEKAPALARISFVQAILVVLMIFAATAMARGLTW